jgi:5-methylcytosine-specific restriction endonuclease McrA
MPYKNKEDQRLHDLKYRAEHKEKIKERGRKYYQEHKEEKQIKGRRNYHDHREEKQIKSREYYQKHKKDINEKSKKYREKRKVEFLKLCPEEQKEYKIKQNQIYCNRNFKNKIDTFNIIGKGKLECSLCGNLELKNLTIDHIDNSGVLERKEGLTGTKLRSLIALGKYPEEKLSNLRLLCWNCNLARSRIYLIKPKEKQFYEQEKRTKLWEEALKFFGPCKTCGESNLIFLTISHIHDNGAELRKNKEEPKDVIKLIRKFKNMGWSESLKESYCIECANCNSGRYFNETKSKETKLIEEKYNQERYGTADIKKV